MEYEDIIIFLAYYLGWSMDTIMGLSPTQISLFQNSIYRIRMIEQGVDPYVDGDTDDKKKIIDKLKLEEIAKNIKKLKEKGEKKADLFKIIGTFK